MTAIAPTCGPATRWPYFANELAMSEPVPRWPECCRTMFMNRCMPGFVLEHVPSPPAGLAPRGELAYFEIKRAGPCDTALTTTREIGVYVPDSFGETVLDLAVLVPG